MVKNQKKVLALILALIMALSMPFSVFAEAGDGANAVPAEADAQATQTVENAIVSQPESTTAYLNESATFTVAASGKVKNYQWQYSKDGRKWVNVSLWYGGKTNTITVPASKAYENAQFRCVVTFKNRKQVISDAVVLTITEKTAPKPYVAVGDEGTLTFETDDYRVSVSYTAEAKIPEGTELTVSPIEYDSDEYWNYWTQSLDKLNENATEGTELEPSTKRSIASAVFFDVSLIYDGQELEPEVPLEVEIQLKDGGLPLFEGQDAEIIHFGKTQTRKVSGTELISDVQVNEAGALGEGMPAGVAVDSFTYEQTGFSVIGAITTDEYIDFEAAEYVANLGDLNNLTATLMAAGLRAAGDPTINAGKTVTDNDGDGIYELALSVNATSQQSSTTKATKSNIVMVIDVSGSMGNEQSWIYYDTYTYNASTYDEYRYYSSSSNMNQRLYYRNGAWRTSNNNYGTVYNGTVYAYETRLHATQRAACAVVDALLAYNNNDDNITDMFEITVCKFANRTANTSQGYNGTQMVIRDSTNATAIKNAINGLTSGGGTNWEAALQLALTEANYYKNTDTSTQADNPENTSVIFLTDGFPTFYGNDSGTGGENNSNISNSYSPSRDDARAIVSAGYTLYNIFAFGSDTTTYNNHTGFAYLRALTNYAYGSGNTDNYNETDVTRQYSFNAKSTDDLVAAFDTIINHITNSVGYAGVNLTDGVSLGATSTSVAVNGTAKPDSMRYTVKDASGKISYTVKFNSSGAATFTIYNADGTTTTLTDNAPETVTTNINGTTITSSVYEVVVGTGEEAKHYKMSPATVNGSTGMVQWDLAGLGILESGYTYTVAFDVWPNQLAYDIAADLNNGIYASVDAALDAYGVTDATERQHIKDAIVHNEDGSYSLYTNYEQGVEYYPATSQTDDDGKVTWTYGDKQTQDIPQPDPVPLKGSLLPLAKVWESDLAISELNELLWENGEVGGTPTKYQITLYVWKAENEADVTNTSGKDPYITQTLGWDDEANAYVWEKDVAVAPGTMVNLAEAEALGFDITDTTKIRTFTNDQGTTLQYYVIETGHYYFVTETGSDLHFEIDSPLYHPMIVDGTLYNVFFGSGQTVEKMDPMYAVTATNYLKGGLNITKTITEFDEETVISGVEDEIAFKITLWKEDEEGNVSPVYTYDDQFGAKDSNGNIDPDLAISGSIGYREFGLGADGKFVTLGRNVVIFEDSTNAAARIEKNKRGTNDPVYATKTSDNKTQIILRMPANGEIRIVNLPSKTKYTVEEIVDTSDEAVYEYFKTESYLKYSVGDEEEEEPTYEEVLELTGTTTDNTVTGTITGNKANVEKYFNKTNAYFYVYHSATNEIERVSFTDSRVEGSFIAADGDKPAHYEYTFDIVEEVGATSSGTAATDLLYGGYYNAYGGSKKADADYADPEKTTFTNDWTTDSTGCTAYATTNARQGLWKKANAYTDAKGTEMHPVKGTVYYLKEVSNNFLTSYNAFVYDWRHEEIDDLFMVTTVDDLCYTSLNYTFTYMADDSAEEPEKVTLECRKATTFSFTVDKTDEAPVATKTITLKTVNENLTDGRGYLGILDVTSYLETLTSAGEFTMAPFWTTLDGVDVDGTGRTMEITETTLKVK